MFAAPFSTCVERFEFSVRRNPSRSAMPRAHHLVIDWCPWRSRRPWWPWWPWRRYMGCFGIAYYWFDFVNLPFQILHGRAWGHPQLELTAIALLRHPHNSFREARLILFEQAFEGWDPISDIYPHTSWVRGLPRLIIDGLGTIASSLPVNRATIPRGPLHAWAFPWHATSP